MFIFTRFLILERFTKILWPDTKMIGLAQVIKNNLTVVVALYKPFKEINES